MLRSSCHQDECLQLIFLRGVTPYPVTGRMLVNTGCLSKVSKQRNMQGNDKQRDHPVLVGLSATAVSHLVA